MKLIEVIADESHYDTVRKIAEKHGAVDLWSGPSDDDRRRAIRMLVEPGKAQVVLDTLQALLAASPSARITLYPVEATIPRPEESEGQPEQAVTTTREELYNDIERSARPDSTFLFLVLLSTLVAAIGLLEDNTAVVIGAMVIAPLLGPNIAFALATALGDTPLMWQAFKTNLAGVILALAMTTLIGLFWPLREISGELLARTDVGLDGIALALASGAAAVLSLTSGLSSVLVGVMVAVALLPPTATMGIMLGSGHPSLALGAALLLAVNVVCINLSAKLVFRFKGVKPRTWLEKRKARQSMTAYTLGWLTTLLLLIAIIFLRQRLV